MITRELIEINRQTGHDRASYNISEKMTENKEKKSQPHGQTELVKNQKYTKYSR